MVTQPRCTEEMARAATRYTGRRGGTDRFSGHSTRKLTTRESGRGLPGYRRTGARGQAPGGTRDSCQTSDETMSFRM